MNLFGKHKISYLNEKWELILKDVKVKAIPRTHEIVYILELTKYFRVVNVIHNIIGKTQNSIVIIEEYTDDDALFENKS